MTLKDFVGQPNNTHTLTAHIVGAKRLNRAVPNILLDWPSGMGKTTLAAQIADEIGAPFHTIDMTTIDGKSAFFDAIYRFNGGVLLLDEFHAVSGRVKESLLPLVYRGQIMRRGQLVRQLPYLTVIGATTDTTGISPALLSRFPIQLECEPYSDDDMTAILREFLLQRKVKLPDTTIGTLAVATGGIPRNAESLALHAEVAGMKATPESICRIAQMELDGLRPIHLRYLQILWDNRMTLNPTALAGMLNIPTKRLALVEELLRRRGYVTTDSGYRRELTPEGSTRIAGEQPYWIPN